MCLGGFFSPSGLPACFCPLISTWNSFKPLLNPTNVDYVDIGILSFSNWPQCVGWVYSLSIHTALNGQCRTVGTGITSSSQVNQACPCPMSGQPYQGTTLNTNYDYLSVKSFSFLNTANSSSETGLERGHLGLNTLSKLGDNELPPIHSTTKQRLSNLIP